MSRSGCAWRRSCPGNCSPTRWTAVTSRCGPCTGWSQRPAARPGSPTGPRSPARPLIKPARRLARRSSPTSPRCSPPWRSWPKAKAMPLDPADSPGFVLWHVTLRWQRAVTAALAPLGLTHVQFVLLASSWWLNAHGDEPNQLSVARQAGTDVKMTSEVLRKLEAKGLIVRTVDVADTRARRIHVTERGSDLAQAAVTAVEGVDAAFFTAVPDPGGLLEMLRTLARAGADVPGS